MNTVADTILKKLDEAIECTVRLRKAKKWLENAKQVQRLELPFSIEGLDDPEWIKYKQHEHDRNMRIELARNEIEKEARLLQRLEEYLSYILPYGVWVMHTYQDREFAIGLAYQKRGYKTDYALRIELIRSDEDLRRAAPLKSESKIYQLHSEWKAAIPLIWGR